MTQIGLFDQAKRITRSSDPRSSLRAALEHIRSGRQGSEQARVYVALRDLGDWRRASEVAAACGLDAYVVRKRLPELERIGVVARGKPIERIGEAPGREQIWIARRSV